LASDLANNNIARYNFITPNLCYDMHDCGIAAGDNWLKAEVPNILNSQAFKNGGALFITWDEGAASTGAQSDGPIGMIMLSPYAKQGYSNQTYYTHSSTLKTMQELFGVFAPAPAAPLIGNDTAGATDLVDFFTTTPTAVPAPLSGTLTGMLSIIAPGGQGSGGGYYVTDDAGRDNTTTIPSSIDTSNFRSGDRR
jgi:hypothetical protein